MTHVAEAIAEHPLIGRFLCQTGHAKPVEDSEEEEGESEQEEQRDDSCEPKQTSDQTGNDDGPPANLPSPLDIECATSAIRFLMGDPKLEVRFTGSELNPYLDYDDERIDIYADQHDNEYWVDPADGTVIQMGPLSGGYTPAQPVGPETRLPVHDLRSLALALAERQIPGFADRLSTLHPLEANDMRTVYFFRWEDLSEPLSETELPPFLQAGLYPDGRLASFANTLCRERPKPPEVDCITVLPSSWSKNKQPE